MEQGQSAIKGFTDSDSGPAQAVAPTVSSELVKAIVELEAQVLGEGPEVLQAEDLVDLLGAVQHRTKGLGRVGRSDTVAAVEVFDKVGQPSVGAFQIVDALQTEFFDRKRSANPRLRVGANQGNAVFFQFHGKSSWSFLLGQVGSFSSTSQR